MGVSKLDMIRKLDQAWVRRRARSWAEREAKPAMRRRGIEPLEREEVAPVDIPLVEAIAAYEDAFRYHATDYPEATLAQSEAALARLRQEPKT